MLCLSLNISNNLKGYCFFFTAIYDDKAHLNKRYRFDEHGHDRQLSISMP